MAKNSTNPEILKIVNKAIKSGAWKLEDGSKHPKLRHTPSGRAVTVSVSPSDHRSALNFKTHIRHVEAGLPGWGQPNIIC